MYETSDKARELQLSHKEKLTTQGDFPHVENCFHLPQIIKRRTGTREKWGGQIKICYAQSSLARATSIFLYANFQIPTDQWTLQRSVQYLACPKDLLKQLFYLNYHFQLYEFSKNSPFYIRKEQIKGVVTVIQVYKVALCKLSTVLCWTTSSWSK